jgi:two-component system nitrogen regulation sensor histidine kinase NtrY
LSRTARYRARLFFDVLIATSPGVLCLGIALVPWSLSAAQKAGLVIFVVASSLALAMRACNRAIHPLRTASSLLAAMRAGDTSLRAAGARQGDAFGDVLWEINELARSLRTQRLQAAEADALLRKVVATTDIGIFAFDAGGRLKLVNPAGAQLIGREATELIGRTASQLEIDIPDSFVTPRIVTRRFPGGEGRYEIRRHTFRDSGVEHELVSVSNLSRALREEERMAWQRLIRVLAHEMNNSLTPIKSIAGTLADLSQREPPPSDWRTDLHSGLSLISQRADSLTRFLLGYTALAKLPPPVKREADLGELLTRVASLEQRLPIEIAPLPAVRAFVDPDQFEQCVINLLRNAVDAALPSHGSVRLSLTRLQEATGQDVAVIDIIDSGPGLVAGENLFVPYFTTKPEGCGIGLALARQIAEGHGGGVTLENRHDAGGCIASLTIPTAGC